MKAVNDIVAALPKERQDRIAARVDDLTKAEISNGWDAESLAAYRRERDKVADKVPGNIVTEFKRGKPAIQIQGARGFDPHRW